MILTTVADRLAKSHESAWTDVRVLDTAGKRGRNAIVMAGRSRSWREPELLVQRTDAKAIKNELGRLQFVPGKLAMGFLIAVAIKAA